MAERGPEPGQAAASAFAAAAMRIAVGQHHRIDGAGAGAADGFDLQALVLQQAVERAPAEGAVGAAALQAEVDFLDDAHVSTSIVQKQAVCRCFAL